MTESSPIEAVIFDADGVLQRPTVRWRPALKSALRLEEPELDGFLAELMAVEARHLENEDDFPDALRPLLAAFGRADGLEAVIGVLNGIDVIAEALSVVDAARRSGRRVFLASNQQAHRADHMSNVLGYGRLFDREFYSCRIGVAKPNPAYFQKILAETGLRAGAALFIDDRPENVRGALSVGMRGFVHDETMGAAALRTALAGFGVTLAPDLSETD